MVVAHLVGDVDIGANLTKGDVDGLLAGCPPWYREVIRLHNGLQVPHPIRSHADLSRSGRIVAIGLSNPGVIPTACHDWEWVQKFFKGPIVNEFMLKHEEFSSSIT